jgi:hypothetical protein
MALRIRGMSHAPIRLARMDAKIDLLTFSFTIRARRMASVRGELRGTV